MAAVEGTAGGRAGLQAGQRAPHVIQQQVGHVMAETVPDDDALYGQVLAVGGQGVSRDEPASGAELLSEVEQAERVRKAGLEPPRRGGDSVGRVAVEGDSERSQGPDFPGEVPGRLVRGGVHPRVAFAAEADERVVLRDDLAAWAGEVQVERGHGPAEVVDVEDQVLGECVGGAPQHPAAAERGEAHLVTEGVDRFHPGKAKVPDQIRLGERGEEPSAGRVHVDVDVQSRVLLQPVERRADGRYVLVQAGEGLPERDDDGDRVLIASPCVGRIRPSPRLGRDRIRCDLSCGNTGDGGRARGVAGLADPAAMGLRPVSRVSSGVTVASASARLARECGARCGHFISAYAAAC